MNEVMKLYQCRMLRACLGTKSTRQLIWHLRALGYPDEGTYIGRCADDIRAAIQRREVGR